MTRHRLRRRRRPRSPAPPRRTPAASRRATASRTSRAASSTGRGCCASPTRSPGEPGRSRRWGLDAREGLLLRHPEGRLQHADPQRVAARATPSTFDASLRRSTAAARSSRYEWDLDGDGEYDDGTDAAGRAHLPRQDSSSVRLRVTDNDGLDDVEAQRLPVTEPPVAALSGDADRPAHRRAPSASTPPARRTPTARSPATSGTSTDGRRPSATRRRHALLDASIPRPARTSSRVLVTDEDGAQATAASTITVRNRPPVAAIARPALPLEDRADDALGRGLDRPRRHGRSATSGTSTTTARTRPVRGTDADRRAHLRHRRPEDGPRSASPTTRARRATASAHVHRHPRRRRRPRRHAEPGLAAPRRRRSTPSGSSDPDAAGPLTFEWDLDGRRHVRPRPARRRATTSWPTAGTRTVRCASPTRAARRPSAASTSSCATSSRSPTLAADARRAERRRRRRS